MQKYITILLGIILISGGIFAQKIPQSPIPTSVSQNCLITQSGTIDFCPTYRNQIRDLNLKLSQQWTTIQSGGVISLLDNITNKLKALNSQSKKLTTNTLSGYSLFISEYEKYLTTLFASFIKKNLDNKYMVQSFFETTYFDQDQGGLGISEVKIYKGIPQQYDDSLLLQVSVRNYTNNPLANIEDLYCFSTINNQDYIYPMGIKTSFKENTITNLIVELKPGISPLLEQIGEKRIACTLVYSQVGQTKYTNRGKLSFLMKQE